MVHGKSYVGIVFNELFIIELFGQNIENLRITVNISTGQYLY